MYSADVVASTKWYLYTGSYDGTVKRWDIATGDCVRTYLLEYGDDNPRMTAGIILLLEIFTGVFYTVSADKVLRCWNNDEGDLLWSAAFLAAGMLYLKFASC